MKKIIACALIVVLGCIFWVVWNKNNANPTISTEKTFVSQKYAIEFLYPALYYLEEKTLGNAEREEYQIVLTEDTKENRDVREGRSPGREGPTAITITLYQNDLDKLSAEDFIKNHIGSDYKLATSELVPTVKGNLQGIEYSTTGLYESNSFVVSTPKYVYKFSVTYMNGSERIISDFENMIKTVVLK